MKKSPLYNQVKSASQDRINLLFLDACRNGELDKVKYFLTSPEINRYADIHVDQDAALLFATREGHYEVIEYLLNSPDLKENISIHAQGDYALIGACISGDIEMAKYLLTSPTLKEHIDIHTGGSNYKSDKPFITAYSYERLELIHYFIFELNIEKTDEIKALLSNHMNEQYERISQTVNSMFEKRELNEELVKELNSDTISKNVSKKAKI